MQVTGAQAMRFDYQKIESSRNFANKIRNAARFVMMNLDGFEPGAPEPITPADKWIFSRLAGLVAAVDNAYENYEFGEITRSLYAFFWNEFCDWYIEFSKGRLAADADPADRLACQRNLMFVLDQAIRLLHPIMPFVTEEIYQELPFDRSEVPYLIGAEWPSAAALAQYVDDDAERAIDLVCETISAVRSTRARYGISPKQALDVVVKAQGADAHLLEDQRSLVESMGNTASLAVAAHASKPEASTGVLGSGLEVYIVLAGLVDFEAERARLQKEREKLAKDEAKLAKKLSNQGFLAKAAPEIIEKDRAKHADLADKIAKIAEQLADLA
jgi:valyl-tRNA synthetase